jgi:aryl-alcohol dehydrogenase-like predicted oxidoreductase
MNYQPLGTSGAMVSQICLGTMTFGDPLGESDCTNLVAHALDRGINFFDTSNVYEGYSRTFGSSGGLGEEMLGKALKGRRDKAILCTKFGNPVGLGPLDAGLSARHLERELEKSLRRLRTEWIDLVLAHRWDTAVSVDEVWRLFDSWRIAGKVRMFGVSNWPTWRIAQISEIAAQNGWPAVSASSPKYNLLKRGVELEHLPCALHYKIALVPYQPLEGGILTGKYRGRSAPAGSRGAEKPGWISGPDQLLDEKIAALERLAQQMNVPLSQYVIAWTLSQPGITSLIMGCRSSEQLDDSVAALELSLPEEHFAQVDSLFPPPQPWGGEQVLFWRDEGWRLEDLES